MASDENLRLQDMELKEIRGILAELGENLAPEQLLAVAEFVDEVGSLDTALSALETLATMRKVA